MAVKPIPDGYPRVSAYLCVNGAAEAIAFYADVLGAVERVRMPGPGGMVVHAELDLGDSVVMLSDEMPGGASASPKTIGGTPVTLSVYVDDVDTVFANAVEKGATAERPVETQFYGDRSGVFVDPWGHRWNVQTHVEDVSGEEMKRRMSELMGGSPA